MSVISPVKFIPDTPTLESAIARVERQFILDGDTVHSVSLRGYGRFTIHSASGNHLYEWSHVNGTRLI